MNAPLMEFVMKHNGSLSIKSLPSGLKQKALLQHPNKMSISKPFMPILTNGHPRLKVYLLVIFGSTIAYEELFKAKSWLNSLLG